MNTESETIFSSTGSMGVSRRQYDRLYVNGEYSEDALQVADNFQRLVDITERYPQIGRSVARGVIDEDVMHHILENGIHTHLEVGLSLEEFGHDESWLAYLSHNKKGRELISPIDEMIRATERSQNSGIQVVDRINRLHALGFDFRNSFDSAQIDQIHAMWGQTFGWNSEEIGNLKNRVDNSITLNESDRDVWFSSVEFNGEIVSLAMAERLGMPAKDDELHLVESTEWRTRDDFSGNGLMTATVAMLNAQVISDMRNHANPPLIYAECNFQSRSDRVGHSAGFKVPDRTVGSLVIPQILAQNVMVHDGVDVAEGKLRDFTFMYVPVQTLQEEYIPHVDDILRSYK